MASVQSNLFSRFWQWNYIKGWKLSMETVGFRNLLVKGLPFLPPEIGTLEFMNERDSRRFMMLVTYDEENEGARFNAQMIFTFFAEMNPVMFFGTEGSWFKAPTEWLRSFPDKTARNSVLNRMLDQFKLSPIEGAALLSENAIEVWGIEEEALYKSALAAYQTRASNYGDILNVRGNTLIENALRKMEEMNLSMGILSLTDYNFSRGHELLAGQGIAHAGIRTRFGGKHHRGYLDEALHKEIQKST
ncbi:MAG TPA: hypothetical protein PKL78_05345 [Anaerolineales bacterium]|nr:hypothetical protein [Anaerolineales bacterium]HNN12961.1 hypothetical protein [Anaerolineales bacterium]